MLQINNIEIIYSDVILVLKGVSLEVAEGKLVTLLGGNGAGKSSTLKAISGLLKTELGKVTDGNIQFDGLRIENGDTEKIAKLGIIQVLEGRLTFEHLTTHENLLVGSHIRRDAAGTKKDLDMVYNYFPRLKDLRNNIAGYLSGGEQQMLVIGRSLMASPKLMLLDEPSLGLSPLLTREIFGIIKRINSEEKTSMLLVEQNVRVALDIAEYGYVMESGRIVLDGSADKLRENEDIKEFYLGLDQLGQRKSYRTIKHYKRRKRWLG